MENSLPTNLQTVVFFLKKIKQNIKNSAWFFIIALILMSTFNSILLAKTIFWQKTNVTLNEIVESIAISASGSIYSGFQGKGIFVSSDEGKTWTSKNSGINNKNTYSFAFRNNGDIFAGTAKGAYLSKDNGNSWESVNDSLVTLPIVSLTFNVDNYLFAAVWNYGVYRTTNFGKNWTEMNNGIAGTDINNIFVNSRGEIFACTYSGMYFSRDNANTWRKINNGLPDPINVYTIAENSKKNLYIGTRNGEIFMTTNNGGSWKYVWDIPTKPPIYSIIIKPNDEIYVGTYGRGVYRSVDDGATWQEINGGLTNLDVLNLAMNSNGDIFAGTWGDGVYKGSELEFISKVSGEYCTGSEIEVSFTSSISYTSNNTFRVQISDSSGSFHSPINIGSLKAGGSSGTIKGIIPKGLPPGTNYKIRVTTSEPNTISEDDGVSIKVLDSPNPSITGKIVVCPNMTTNYVAPISPNVDYTWYIVKGDVKSVTKGNVEVTWGSVGKGNVKLVMTNNITGCSDSTNLQISIEIPPAPAIYRKGMELHSTYKYNNQWYMDGIKIEGATDSLYKPEDTGSYTVQAVDSNGCVTPMSDPYYFDIEHVEDLSFKNGAIFIYPNPASGFINIEFETYAYSSYSISLFDLMNREIKKDMGNLDSGKYKSGFDVSDLAEGVYFIRFTFGNKNFFEKVIIRR